MVIVSQSFVLFTLIIVHSFTTVVYGLVAMLRELTAMFTVAFAFFIIASIVGCEDDICPEIG